MNCNLYTYELAFYGGTEKIAESGNIGVSNTTYI